MQSIYIKVLNDIVIQTPTLDCINQIYKHNDKQYINKIWGN